MKRGYSYYSLLKYSDGVHVQFLGCLWRDWEDSAKALLCVSYFPNANCHLC